MDAGKALWKSAENTLCSLGRSAMQTLTWQLINKDTEMTPDNFDIEKFALELGSLLGEGAEPLLSRIHRNLCKQLGEDPAADLSLPALDRIKKILEAKKIN
jgi:hypothetical protein